MSLQHLSPNSRVWFFISNRPLTSEEANALSGQLHGFVGQWQAHGKDLSAGFGIFWNALVVVAVDESVEMPTGCSIDKVFKLLQEFGSQNHLDFFNRLLLLVPTNEHSCIIYTQQAAKEAVDSAQLLPDTMVANVLHQKLGGFNAHPTQYFNEHWMFNAIG